MTVRSSWLGCLTLALAQVLTAGLASAADHDPDAPRVPRVSTAPVIDGVLDEPLWAEALVLELKYETRPAENGPAPVKTRVHLAYDSDALYIAFDAEDPDPSQIRARLRDRDRAYDDDFVGIVIDTFDDHLRAVEFFVNPYGVQMDLFQDDSSGNEDDSWDAIWDSAGQIHAGGFRVEMAIPMRALRFPGHGGDQLWGVDLLRFYPRDNRYRLSVNKQERGRNCYLCQNMHVRGFEGITPGRNLEVVPSLIATKADARPAYGAPFDSGKLDVEPSLNVRWGVTPNVILNAALNPDFSQVEADSAQLDVNNQFALFFAEKRPFFLEGADIFQTPVQAVYTRNIASPDYGLKLTGKAGKNAFGAFAVDDELLNLTFPGSMGSAFDSVALATEAQVLRYRRDVGEGSTVGALVTHRSGDGYDNLVYGTDARFRFKKDHSVSFQYLRSSTDYPDAVATANAQPLDQFSDDALRLQYAYATRGYDWFARWEDFGRGFRADLGYVPQVDYQRPIVGGSKSWYPADAHWINKVRLYTDWDRTSDQAGQLLEQEIEAYLSLEGGQQTFLEVAVVDRLDFMLNGVQLPNRFYGFYGESTPWAWLSLGGYLRTGDGIDFDNTRLAKETRLEPWITLRPGDKLNLNLAHYHRELEVGGGRLFSADLTELRATWQFDTRRFVRIISQYQDVQRDPARYTFVINPRDQDLANQILFAWKANPQTVFYLGYSDGHYAADADRLEQQNRTLFLKLSYAWVL
jgi:hypothetical protein